MYGDYHEPRTESDFGAGGPIVVVCVLVFLLFIFWPSFDSPKIETGVPGVSNNQVILEAFDEVSKSCLKNDGIKEVILVPGTIDMDIEIICNDGMSKKIRNIPINK